FFSLHVIPLHSIDFKKYARALRFGGHENESKYSFVLSLPKSVIISLKERIFVSISLSPLSVVLQCLFFRNHLLVVVCSLFSAF
ncbi:hypothetical protein, partial [Xenorhabdus nematophila]|uniref:hypothetical protein n=1 Tax=Xenorhabdus nematophila TaxID=628 RepID=UPI001E2F4D20